MSLSDYMRTLKRSSKKDDPIGVTTLDELCPACGKNLKSYPACCGSPNGYKGCLCGWKVVLTS